MSSLLDLDKDPYETVARWRGRTGGQLAAIMKNHRGIHLQVIFGNYYSSRPPSTPLFQIISAHHEVELETEVLELWQRTEVEPHPQILDFEVRAHPMRAVVVASPPMEPELIQELLDCVRQNADQDLPAYLLTA